MKNEKKKKMNRRIVTQQYLGLKEERYFQNTSSGTVLIITSLLMLVAYIKVIDKLLFEYSSNLSRLIGVIVLFALGYLLTHFWFSVAKYIYGKLIFKCKFCGEKNKGDSYFCKKCLSRIDIDGIYNVFDMFLCPKCNEIISKKGKRCPNCNYSLRKYVLIWKKGRRRAMNKP